MHILVADPTEAFAILLSEELQRHGYTTRVCYSSAEALAAARERRPDMAILDMALEDPDALTLANQLRALDPTIRLMLIPLMGQELPPGAASLSIQGVLPKPFFIPELPGIIEAAFRAPIEAVQPEPQVEVASPPRKIEPEPPVEPVRPVAAAVAVESVGPEMPTEGLSAETLRAVHPRVLQVMNALMQEAGADLVLLTLGNTVAAWVGRLQEPEAASLARAVVNSWRTSAEIARILGGEQSRFEQSTTGGGFMLYALSVEANAILVVAVRGSAPLGLLRHRARLAAREIARLCA